MWKAVDKMTELGIKPNTHTYTLIISRHLTNENFEMALQALYEMSARGLAPELKTVQGVITLATKLNSPRLALDLARSFEESSVRNLDAEVWMNCLVASAQDLYVSIQTSFAQCSIINTYARWTVSSSVGL
jgi:pentatricopeptide repeat protein